LANGKPIHADRRRKDIKRAITSIAFIAIAAMIVSGAAIAWFTAATEVENTFTAGTVKVSAGYSADFWTQLGGYNYILVQGPRFADTVVSFQQGKRKNLTDVLPERSNPNVVLQDNADFFSLGFNFNEFGVGRPRRRDCS
jgi:predicted ribosomally synthesized peptide with SipW-like signal peptide